MKVLVTGAGGFLGGHMVGFLRRQDAEVHTVGIKRTSGDHHFADFRDREALISAVRSAAPDYVLHLAGTADAGKDFIDHYYVNTFYAAELLKALEAAGRADCPVLLVGTAVEYGLVGEDRLPITEDTPTRPRTHYGISKLAQTLMGQTLAKDQGRPLIMARAFNIIGPGMSANVSVRAFAGQIADHIGSGGPPVVAVGNLSAARDFTDVKDVVKILWLLARTPRAYGEIVNVCSGTPVVMRDLLDKLIKLSGADIQVRVDPARVKKIDFPVSYGSTQKLFSFLGNLTLEKLDDTLKVVLDDLVGRSSGSLTV